MDDLDNLLEYVEKQNKRLPHIVTDLAIFGVSVCGINEGSLDIDPSIDIDENTHIHVGLNGYLSLVNKLPDGNIKFYPPRKTPKEVTNDYLEMIKNGVAKKV
jgi:hypothetical protein